MSDYYHKNYKEFFVQTADIDPSSFLSPFVNAIPSNISILDVGCGSGRDLLWLKKQGFHVTGFERSPGLAGLAGKHSGCDVIEGDFESYDFSKHNFDAILASGSLVHVPHDNLVTVLNNIIQAFNQNSILSRYMYISLKSGIGIKRDSKNRKFFLWDNKILKKIFTNLGFSVVSASKSQSLKNSKDLWLGYVLNKAG